MMLFSCQLRENAWAWSPFTLESLSGSWCFVCLHRNEKDTYNLLLYCSFKRSFAGFICLSLSLPNGPIILLRTAENDTNSEIPKWYFSSWCDDIFFFLQAHHLLPSTWFLMSTRHPWTWNGAVLRTQVVVRIFPTMLSVRSVELVTPASADPVEVGSTTPHSRMAWRPPKSLSLTSWHIPITRLKSGQWMVCPSITPAPTSQFLSPWQPTKQVGIRCLFVSNLNVYCEKDYGDDHKPC